MPDDKQLLMELKKGSENAFQSLFYKYYPELVGEAYIILKDRARAEDLVQDFFVDFWLKQRYASVTSLKSYLFFSIRNASLNLIRDDKSHKKREADYKISNNYDIAGTDPNDDAASYIENESNYDKICNCINKLPETRRRILILCYYHNMKYKEVAQVLNISINTVKVQMGRAFKFIRENILCL